MTETDVQLMSSLDAAMNKHGHLSAELRARIYAAIANPTPQTWADARTVIIVDDGGVGITLWQAVKEHTSYVNHPGDVTPPTSDQLRTALAAAVR